MHACRLPGGDGAQSKMALQHTHACQAPSDRPRSEPRHSDATLPHSRACALACTSTCTRTVYLRVFMYIYIHTHIHAHACLRCLSTAPTKHPHDAVHHNTSPITNPSFIVLVMLTRKHAKARVACCTSLACAWASPAPALHGRKRLAACPSSTDPHQVERVRQGHRRRSTLSWGGPRLFLQPHRTQ